MSQRRQNKQDKIIVSNINSHFKATRSGDDSEIPEADLHRSSTKRSHIKEANIAGGSVGSGSNLSPSQILFTSPQFYSPIHTPVNWQIPSKRREVYLWNRFFASNEPKIIASLRFYSQFPFSGFKNVINDPIRAEHFDTLRKRLNLDRWLPLIAYEYFAMGDVFPFINFYCEKCLGTSLLKDGSNCNHEGGTVSMISVLNPDWIDVKMNPIDPNNPTISLVPDDTLKQIVWSKNPPEIYNALPDVIKKLILSNKPIPLSKRSITHLKHDEIPYQPYGRSILASLFPTLAYQDKLRQAQWIVAERHILPIKVVKVGNDQRPAGAGDIADVQSQLAATANDPNLTLVTHHAFDFQWIGACHDDQTEVLTEDGWKKYWDVEDNEKIMIFDKESEEMRYENFMSRFEYKYKGDLINIKGGEVDICVTPNHKMLFQRLYHKGSKGNLEKNYGEWEVSEAKNLKSKYRFRATAKWIGNYKEKISILGKNIDMNLFLEYLGYYLSEGFSYYSEPQGVYMVSISQGLNSPYYNAIKLCSEKMAEVLNKHLGENTRLKNKKNNGFSEFIIYSKDFSKYMKDNFGKNSKDKFVPKWIKSLCPEQLEIMLEAMCDGDAIKQKNSKGRCCRLRLVTTKLVEDMGEVAFKCGYSVKTSLQNHRSNIKWLSCGFSDNNQRGRTPEIRNKSNIIRKHYDGQVWCFETTTGFFITRRNGKITIQGNSGKVLQLTKEWDLIDKNIIQGLGVNEALLSGSGPSYSQAAIGIEATIRRLDIVRNLIANWIEEKIYKEEARMQCFYKENLRGEKILDYPTIKWDDLNLRDETQKNQMYLQLWDKAIVSTQFICEQFGIDYEIETERVRLEQQFQQQFGISPKQRGPGGKMPGGKGSKGPGAPLGGGFGGGGPKGPGGDAMKGNLPGGQSGPGLPGDSIAPSMSGGEGGPMASLNERIVTSQTQNNTVPHSQAYELAKQLSPLVSKPGKYRIRDKDLLHQIDEKRYVGLANGEIIEEEPEIYEGPRTGLYRPTNIEGMLYTVIASAQEQGNLPDDFYYQINPEPDRMPKITCDGVFPSIRLIIEADGKQFHASEEDIEKNTRRDNELRSYNWIVLRYTEDEIKYRIDEVLKSIIEMAQSLMETKEQTHP